MAEGQQESIPMIQPELEDLPKDKPKLENKSLGSQAVNKSPTQYHCDICQNIRVILLVFTMKMEILLESASNKLLVGILQLNELMDLCAKLSDRVLALENTNTSQAVEIATLKERVKKLEKKSRSRTYKPRRLYKGRKIADLDADTEVTLIDETQGRNDEDLMFDTSVLNGEEVFQEPMVNTATTTSSILISYANPVTTASKVVTTTSVEIPEELTLAQTLIEIKSAKPKAVTTAATTVSPAISRPKAKGIAKDKGKEKMVEPEKPLKKKDQITINEEVARNLEAQLQAELEEEESLSRQKEEEANIDLIES
ncbi:hypothetical protein Tco_1166787 [Tanacetum coccineum]